MSAQGSHEHDENAFMHPPLPGQRTKSPDQAAGAAPQTRAAGQPRAAS
jgi:hypothetical protein